MKRTLALASLIAMAACGGGGSGSVVPNNGGGQSGGGSPLLARIVGVGDSLTAGYQADGILGQTGVADPLFPGLTIPPTQEQGYWADVDEQASGVPVSTAINQMFDPSVSPLPLIAGPGLNNQIVPALPPAPFGFEKPGNACADDGGFNAAGYLLGGSSRVRMNPSSTVIRNVSVPGITLHEANTLAAPQSNTCKTLPGIRGLLAQVVDGESSTYWPVLRNWSYMGQGLTMVNAAARLKPTLALVWLGANDVLKYMGSGGLFHGGDLTVAQASGDVRQTIYTLNHAGAHVVVANLPNILETPYFQRVTVPRESSNACEIQTYVVCLLSEDYGYQLATRLTDGIAKAYNLATPSGCAPTSLSQPCGYLTLQGTLQVLSYYNEHGKLPDLDNGHPGSGLGTYYITPTFAAKVQSVNNTINSGIGTAAQRTSTPLVDVQAIFAGIASGNPSNPYFAVASHINKGICCTLAYEGGLVSFDGLHPSNTGYALLASAFIAAINQAYGAKIPQINIRAAYNGTRCSNPDYCYPDPYAPPNILVPLLRAKDFHALGAPGR
ncbi:MAG: SGNH/GDSL hydrolase family protein [Candidatus Tumulicola sp.]